MKRQAINVMTTKGSTIFVIEGFERKSVELDKIQGCIKNYYERLYGLNNAKVEEVCSDFLVTIKDETTRLTWSWVSSYIVQ